MKTVKLEFNTFLALVRYFILDERTEELHEEIKKTLESKIDSMARHELYTQSKTAPTEAEREQARQKYLDSVGIHKDFRW